MADRINTIGLYNNRYNQIELEVTPINFKLKTEDDDFEFKEQLLIIHKIIDNSNYNNLITDEIGQKIRIKKETINELFELITIHSNLDYFVIFSVLCYYLDLNYSKMLKLLSNKFKIKIISIIDKQISPIMILY